MVIDASLNKRLATELNRRGRRAIALSELKLRHEKDPDLLRALAATFAEPWVLVTADDNLPAAHHDVVAETGATVCTVDPHRGSGYELRPDEWGRDVVHRWAHAMAQQSEGTVKRYSASGGRRWTRRRR